jgi:hypothetical protein
MATKLNNDKNVKNSKPTPMPRPESDSKISDVKEKRRGESKQSMLIKLLERPEGAAIDEMVKATGWQRHSIRGLISGVLKKRLGRSITSEKGEHGRVYRMAAI